VDKETVLNMYKRKPITTKWVFKKKVEQDQTIRYKARCVSRGFMQIPGVDYTESFAPVASDTGIRVVIGIYLYYEFHNPSEQWVLESFDVEAAFLNAKPSHATYIEWPKGIKELKILSEEEIKTTCAELTAAMYGNIDSPLQWMKTFSNFLKDKMKMVQSAADPCIFYKMKEDKIVLILVLYVDDTLCTGRKEEVEWAYKMIEKEMKIERLGKLKKHLGIWYKWKKDEQGNQYLEAHMPKMVEEITQKFFKATGKEAKEYDTPGPPGKTLRKNEGPIIELDEYRSIVGKIMYFATKLCPDVSNSARELASHLSNPGVEHWKALERCVGYIKNKTNNRPLILRRPRELRSISDCDSNYGKDEIDRRSVSGRINTLGGMLTNHTSKKQQTVSLSSSEAEYQALSECVQEAVFTQNLVKELTGVSATAII
jgi:hypothetical protein